MYLYDLQAGEICKEQLESDIHGEIDILSNAQGDKSYLYSSHYTFIASQCFGMRLTDFVDVHGDTVIL